MKLFTISLNQLELARAQFIKPLFLIGRSPSCDLVLRAPDVEPVQFLVEWIGQGNFDSSQGAWSIVDISDVGKKAATENTGEISGKSDSGEGVVLSGNEAVTLNGFTFQAVEDRLASDVAIGGQIVRSLGPSKGALPEVLEIVQIRHDSGAVEEIRHIPVVRNKRKKEQVLKNPKQFKIEWTGADKAEALLKILLNEMLGARISNRGQMLNFEESIPLRAGDLIRVKWSGQDFYLRFVEEVDAPPIPRDFFGDPLLRKLTLWVSAGMSLILILALVIPKSEEPPKIPPRVATVEVTAPPDKEPKAEPTVQDVESPNETETEAKEKPEPKVATTQKEALKSGAKAGKISAPRFTKEPDKKPTVGLNSPAKVTDVNSVGILGSLKPNSRPGSGVAADKVINEGIITQSVSGLDSSKIVIKNPPSGILGGRDQGTGGKTTSLGAASTTLSGAGKYDPNSLGAVARKGGISGNSLGDTSSGTGKGLSGGNSFGSLDGGDFSVEGGGLDRETVRRIIASYRGQVRTCYERALLTHSNLEGRIVYNWRIGASDGTVVEAAVTKSTLDVVSLQTCVLEVIRNMKFPKAPNGKSTRVIYPFVFQGKR